MGTRPLFPSNPYRVPDHVVSRRQRNPRWWFRQASRNAGLWTEEFQGPESTGCHCAWRATQAGSCCTLRSHHYRCPRQRHDQLNGQDRGMYISTQFTIFIPRAVYLFVRPYMCMILIINMSCVSVAGWQYQSLWMAETVALLLGVWHWQLHSEDVQCHVYLWLWIPRSISSIGYYTTDREYSL